MTQLFRSLLRIAPKRKVYFSSKTFFNLLKFLVSFFFFRVLYYILIWFITRTIWEDWDLPWVVLLLDPFFDWVEFFLSLMDGFRLPIGGDGSGIGSSKRPRFFDININEEPSSPEPDPAPFDLNEEPPSPAPTVKPVLFWGRKRSGSTSTS